MRYFFITSSFSLEVRPVNYLFLPYDFIRSVFFNGRPGLLHLVGQ
jgi:hypothetical protein